MSAQVSAAPLSGPVGPVIGGGPTSSDVFGPTTSNLGPTGPGWQFGLGDSDFVEIAADKISGQWEKTLLRQTGVPLEIGVPYYLVEELLITDGAHWKTWNEFIVTQGWIFLEGFLTTSDDDVQDVIGTLGGGGTSIHFDVANLEIGTEVYIVKQLMCTGVGIICNEQDVLVRQYAGVPEPATLAMLGGGLALLGLRRRRRQ